MRHAKVKKRKLLVKPKSYSGPGQDSQTAIFPKAVNGLNLLTNFGKNCFFLKKQIKILINEFKD